MVSKVWTPWGTPQATSESDNHESKRSLRDTPSDSPGEKDVPPDTFKNKRESRSTPVHIPGPEDFQSLACLWRSLPVTPVHQLKHTWAGTADSPQGPSRTHHTIPVRSRESQGCSDHRQQLIPCSYFRHETKAQRSTMVSLSHAADGLVTGPGQEYLITQTRALSNQWPFSPSAVLL